jgi:ABC-2 type transport system permease protein
VVVHRRYNPEAISAYNIVPGLLGVILSMTLVMMTALGITRERARDDGDPAGDAGEAAGGDDRQAGALCAGRADPDHVVILVLARVLFDVPFAGGWAALVTGILLFIIGSLALGFLISTVARNQLQAMQMSVFYIFPSILLSGFMFPFRGMPSGPRRSAAPFR